MNAVVSGHSGVALLIEDDAFSSIHFGEGEVRPRRPSDFRLLFNGARDLRFLEDVDLAEVRRQLDLESTHIDALHLALILLDRELEHDTRRTAAEELEELLTDESTIRWVEGVLHARQLPGSGDLVGARNACTGRTQRTRAFLEKLESLQSVIAEVQEAWERVPTQCFGTDDDRQHVLSIVVREGLFRDLVAIRAAGQPSDKFISRSLRRPPIAGLAGAQQVLWDWVKGLRGSEEIPEPRQHKVSYVAEDKPQNYWSDPWPAATPEDLLRQYHRPVISFFLKRGFSAEESRDLAQATFLRVFHRWDSFRGESSVETWLFQIASNLYKNTLRSLQTQRHDAQEVPLDPVVEIIGSGESDPLRNVLTEEKVRLLRNALEDLPPQMRQAVFLRVEGNLKYREIAEVMHVSIETVKAHMYQARQHLRDRLADFFTDTEDL